ncbi:MAG: hypothetical protein K5886_03480 [Lachnospiraceae bacterium]|nr:hypothetical protein [Lachnospiraceae bacterium]
MIHYGKDGENMGQGFFESDEAYRARMLNERGEAAGVTRGFFESSQIYAPHHQAAKKSPPPSGRICNKHP